MLHIPEKIIKNRIERLKVIYNTPTMEDDDAAVRACALNELKFLNNILERHGKREDGKSNTGT